MGSIDINRLLSILVCPRCRSALVQSKDRYLCANPACAYSNDLCFPVIGGYPVLVDFEQSILIESEVAGTLAASPIHRINSSLVKKIKSVLFPSSPVVRKNVTHFRELLRAVSENPIVLIIGGATASSEIETLYNDSSLQLISFDIYGTPLTQFVADGHQIPLDDQSMDGVCIQAVLEHVLDPWQVVSEIYRVLKKDGIAYAETPFMQQVHEGPYDFTRFTDSGHRWLFKKFELIDSGVLKGPGTQLSWTINHIIRGILRSKIAGVSTRMLLFWVRYIDKIIPTNYAVDSASCVFFIGRKSEREITPKEMVSYYKGAQQRV